MKTIELQEVCRTYGRSYAVYNVTHTFRQGTCSAILGGNGAGKSTLLRMIATLESPTRGEILYNDLPHRRFLQVGRSALGWLSHETQLYPELTGRENLRFFAQMYGVVGCEEVVSRWLRRVGLSDAADRPTSEYSRGMVQRLAIARTLLHTPRIILLDEPFTGLDQESRQAMATMFGKLRDAGCIVIMITHDFAFGGELVDEVLLLREGELVEAVSMSGDVGATTLADIYEQHLGSH